MTAKEAHMAEGQEQGAAPQAEAGVEGAPAKGQQRMRGQQQQKPLEHEYCSQTDLGPEAR